MSRSGYSDDCDSWELIKWRGMVASATRGKRGQKLLRELAEAMDAMPVKRLIANELEVQGEYCALGVAGAHRGVDMSNIDPDEPEQVAKAFDIATCLASEIVYWNDEVGPRNETPEARWQRMRKWVGEQCDSLGEILGTYEIVSRLDPKVFLRYPLWSQEEPIQV